MDDVNEKSLLTMAPLLTSLGRIGAAALRNNGPLASDHHGTALAMIGREAEYAQSTTRETVAEVARMRNANAVMIEALHQISGGSFSGASTLAMAGDWHEFTNRLQAIATSALPPDPAI